MAEEKREACARPYHICLNLWHKPPVQDHGPRVDTRSDFCPVCGLKDRGWIERETTGGAGRANLTRIREYCNDPFHAAASQEAGRGTEEK